MDYLALGIFDLFVSSGIIFFLPIVLIVPVGSLFSNYASIAISRKMQRLREYSESMRAGGTPIGLAPLYRFRNVLLVAVVFSSVVQPIYIFSVLPQTWTIQDRIFFVLPYEYWILFLSTFLWVWGYSLYSVYRMGKLPLGLKPFTEDRTLGLKPFGRASLLMTGAYVAFLSLFLIPQVIIGFASVALLAWGAAMMLVGVVFFLAPLVPLHTKLISARQELLGWIGPRYTTAMDSFRSTANGPVSQDLVGEFSVIEKVQHDVNQIHTWPFDTGLIVKLAAIIFSVVAIIGAKFVQIALGIT